MAEFKISRFRYVWKGAWTSSFSYKRDDIVSVGAKSYVCLIAHTSQASFYSDFSIDVPKWTQMTDGFRWRNNWLSSTFYALGDIVAYAGALYLITEEHTSQSTFAENIDKVTVYAFGSNWNDVWTTGTRYGVNDIVKYNGIVYRCIEEHTSASSAADGLTADIEKWAVYVEFTQFIGDFSSLTVEEIKLNDIIKLGGALLRCIQSHETTSEIDSEKFTTYLPSNRFREAWNNSVFYGEGDVVLHGGYLYQANLNNINSNPSDSIYQPDESSLSNVDVDWKILSKGFKFRGSWNFATEYQTGDVVSRGGNLYIALIDSRNDGSTLDYIDESNWGLIVPGLFFRGVWTEDTDYSISDAVLFDGGIWKCIVSHTSTNQNYPGDNGSGFLYWEILLEATIDVGMRVEGDLLTFGLSRDLTGDDTSTVGLTRVPIGELGETLYINDSGGPGVDPASAGGMEYRQQIVNPRTKYVGIDGIDDISDPLRGTLPELPWRTINFACKVVEDEEYQGPTTINVLPGIYEEILPIVVPALTAIRGSELRSTKVRPKPANPNLIGDLEYSLQGIDHLILLMDDIITGTEISQLEEGNTFTQDTTNVSTIDISASARSALESVKQYLLYYINDIGSAPAMTGSNTADTSPDVVAAIAALEANKSFLGKEVALFVQRVNPSISFDSAQCERDIRFYIDALKYDLKYLGNYRSLRAAEQYVNAVVGSEYKNMFLVRDSTGIRNLTLDGLLGILPDLIPTDFDDDGPAEDARPAGGIYVSLDPGWGPNDQKVWIVNRSCYVQNVTTFGYGAVGQKIDGALHNGGNKSIVSNDFTQVISDGIGAWVLNNGLAELVSVFTYYSHIGYLAETGGRIRATNGNNSYGNYGALANGVDPNEVAKTGTVNNRDNQATVASVLAGEISDDILIVEFANAGTNYQNAVYSIRGSGLNASAIQDDYRDDAVFQARLIDADGSSTPGGLNYKNVGNNAQTGTSTSITLATNDPASSSDEYVGLRIVLISGTGTGQYAEIASFNPATKVCNVKKESTGEPGWDHVIPGTPIAGALTTQTTYRIEAMITFSAPSYSAETLGLPITFTAGNIVFGDTNKEFTNVAGSEGEGTVVTDDGLTPITATFDVEKTGRTYSVTINNPGAGYADEQQIIISGADVGGATPDNDIFVTVKSISDDSTNSITSFVFEGEASSGIFVATPAAGRDVLYSQNGTSWTGNLLPSDGDWRCLAAGGNRFIAIKYNSNEAVYSDDGETWTSVTVPQTRQWQSAAFGKRPNNNGEGVFVAISSDLNGCAVSTNYGTSWSTSVSMPTIGDSAFNEWIDITYGQGKFVAIANSNNISAVGEYDYSTGTLTWEAYIMDVIADSSQRDWVSVAYGNGRFVAISSQGDIGYSFDGISWSPATMPTQDGSTIHNWKKIRYGQGVFIAVGDTGGRDVFADPTTGPTTFIVESSDGIVWTSRETQNALNWGHCAFGNPRTQEGDSTRAKNTGMWILAASDAQSLMNRVFTGARAKGRATIQGTGILGIKLWDVGSGYLDQTPTITVFDPNATSEAFFESRIGDGVLAQPSWLNRGFGYRSSSTFVTITGDGFADVYPVGKFVTISNMQTVPRLGAQLTFEGNSTVYTVADIIDDFEENFSFTAQFRITPSLEIKDNLEHGTSVAIRENYSQCRITGHDFLDVGTGNFIQSNYPEIYQTGAFENAPENEVVEKLGGRVFYTSTDQIGNFRVGELFAVEQATGIVTISAEFFDLSGLTELRLGGVRLGGSGVLIKEFSTDPLFVADSNNIIPTQRAIAAYLRNRLTIGGSELTTASFIAGTVRVGPDKIDNSAGLTNELTVVTDFDGPEAGITGAWVADIIFHKSFNDDPGVLS